MMASSTVPGGEIPVPEVGPAAVRPLRVAVADSRPLLRSGLRSVLASTPDLHLVAEARSVADIVEVAARSRPDVVLMHLGRSGDEGLEIVRALARGAPAHRVVVYASPDTARCLWTALHHGARGFLLVDDRPSLLVEAVRSAAAGDVLISPALTATVLSRRTPPAQDGFDPAALSRREIDVVRAVALGMTNAEIARQAWMSVSTVKHHLAAVQQKLCLRNRVEVAVWAWRAGLAC